MNPEEFKKKMEEMKKQKGEEGAIKPETTGGVIADSKNVFDLDKLENREEFDTNKKKSGNVGHENKGNNEVPAPHPSGLRTLTTDISDAARNEELSVIKIALAEQRKKDTVAEYYSPKSKKNLFYIFASIIFIIISILIIYLLITKNKTAPVDQMPVTYNKGNNLIATDSNKIIRITKLAKEQSIKTIKENLNADVKNNVVTNYRIIDEGISQGAILTSNEFLKKVEAHIPITFISELDSDFILGTVGQVATESKNIPFLIIKGSDNQGSASGMYTWEKTMLDDFYLMWGIDIGGSNTTLLGRNFQNSTILNKDSRVLVDNAGKTILMYMFLDDKTILITTTPDIVQEILNRFYNAVAS